MRTAIVAVLGLLAALSILAAWSAGPPASSAAAPQAPTSAPTGAPLVIVPWLEYASTPGMHEETLRGMREWQTVTDRVIVSVIYPKDYGVLRTLRAQCPGLRIIPGLKTSTVLDPKDFASPARWEQIARSVAQLLEDTGEHTLLFENETAVRDYIEGRAEIDLERLRRCLQQLPRDVRYLWYPATSGAPDRFERYQRVNRVVQEVCDAELVDHNTLFGPREYNEPGTRELAERLRAGAKHAPVPMLYCYGDEPGEYARVWWWRDAQLPEILAVARERFPAAQWAIVYPGARRWASGARAIAGVLLQHQPPSAPTSPPGAPATRTAPGP